MSEVKRYTPRRSDFIQMRSGNDFLRVDFPVVKASDYEQLKAEKEQAAILAETFRTAWCVLNTEREQLKAENERLGDVLRSIACSLGAGGYNASAVDPDVFMDKIRWGIDALTAPLITERDTLRKQLDEEQKMRFEGNRIASEDYCRDTKELRTKLDEARELLVAAQELLYLVWEYDGDVFGREHNNATDVNIGITAWLEAIKK